MGKCQYCGQWAGFGKKYHDRCRVEAYAKEKALAIVNNLTADRRSGKKIRLEKAQEAYRKAFNAHIEQIEKIGQMYSVAINLYAVDGPEMQQVEELCKEDINFLREYRQAEKEQYEAWKDYNLSTSGKIGQYMCPPIEYWDSYKRLAIIYEKQKRWQEAIDVCESAIAHGITKDGNQSGFIGRAARLTRKMRDATTQKLEQ